MSHYLDSNSIFSKRHTRSAHQHTTLPALERLLNDTFQGEIAQLGALLSMPFSVSKWYCQIKSLSNMRGFIIVPFSL